VKAPRVLLAALALAAAGARANPGHPLERRIVSVRVTYQSWNEYRPWAKNQPGTRACSGLVVAGPRILIPWQLVEDATLVQVLKYDRPPRVPARVAHADPQADLALLAVDEPGFFDDLAPAPVAAEARLGPALSAGWRDGQLVTAACRFSRSVADESRVPHLYGVALRFVTDLKGGGWGEPLFSGDEMIGLAQYQDEDTLTVIPAESVRAFLDAVDSGRPYPGRAFFGGHEQYNRNAAQLAWLGMPGPPRGVMLRYAVPGGSFDGVLRERDVLLEIDGRPVGCEGDILHPRYGRLSFDVLASGRLAEGTMPARVFRDGREQALDIPLRHLPAGAAPVPDRRVDAPPPYLVAGGFVFRELDAEYLRAWGDEWRDRAPRRLRIHLEMSGMGLPAGRRRFIVLSHVLPDAFNVGYHDLDNLVVDDVNGRRIESIRDLDRAFAAPAGEYHVVRFVPNSERRTVVLDAAALDAATAGIMEAYQIPARARFRDDPP
jgi:hypothetical protein